jgi:hypothetical protein
MAYILNKVLITTLAFASTYCWMILGFWGGNHLMKNWCRIVRVALRYVFDIVTDIPSPFSLKLFAVAPRSIELVCSSAQPLLRKTIIKTIISNNKASLVTFLSPERPTF